MKKHILLFVTFLLCIVANAQKTSISSTKKEFEKTSKIDEKTIAAINSTDLKAIALIWGFLKYYHPAVIAGKYNWDYELFVLLPKIAKTKTVTERDEVLAKWIQSLGTFPIGKYKSPDENATINTDLSWISASGFSDDLRQSLEKIRTAKRSGQQFYCKQLPSGTVEFTNENAYADMKFPDAGYRLLALYRYWNCMNYFFPYKYLIEQEWENILAEFTPKFTKASDELSYKLTLMELLGKIPDSNSNIMNQSLLAGIRGINIAPIKIKFIENKAVVTGFYNDSGKSSGLAVGDVISHINDKFLDPIVQSRMKHLTGSNKATKFREAAQHLLRTNDSILLVSFVRKGILDYKNLKTIPFSQTETKIKSDVTDNGIRFITPKIAYLFPINSTDHDNLKLISTIENTEAIIVDLRSSSGTFTDFGLGSYFKAIETPFALTQHANLKQPGNFSIVKKIKNGGGNHKHYLGKIVVLVNEYTQGKDELTALALKSVPNAIIIGSATAGTLADVSTLNLPGGIIVGMSSIATYCPDEKETQQIGITVDVEVKQTIRGIRDGRDEILEKAIEILTMP